MRTVQLVFSLAVVAIIVGCAHPLAINPDIAKIERESSIQPIAKNIGYYIAPDVRERSVTTPGGGGDSVTYFPYKDIEAGFYKMLSNVFQNVTQLKSPNDANTIGKQSITYVITPEITTDSSSPSPFTWAPTRFSLNLTCSISDNGGKLVTKTSVRGEGQAEYDEFKSDFSLAGNRAAQDALLKMQSTLLRLPELRSQ